MKITFDKKKGTETLQNIVSGTVDLGKKVATTTKQNVSALAEKTRKENLEKRIRKYNPLFLERFMSSDFALPNIIVIVDDAVRRGVDVCEGAIGWIDSFNGVETLCLYDEAIAASGIEFLPTASCDSVYCVDNFNRNRFVRADYVFTKAHEERMAELKHIAYSLGAKRCSIEICETTRQTEQKGKLQSVGAKAKGQTVQIGSEQQMDKTEMTQRSGSNIIEFAGNSSPLAPNLKWFAQDDNINRLIEMRCKQGNAIKSERLELSGANFTTMSQKIATAIDGAIGKIGGLKSSNAISSLVTRESNSKLVFCIEF